MRCTQLDEMEMRDLVGTARLRSDRKVCSACATGMESTSVESPASV